MDKLKLNYQSWMAVLWAVVCSMLQAEVVAAEDTKGNTELANNLLTDFAPLLALFGERVAQQFLSQSMGIADCIIFAVAPLGIITAIVGAIRCGGPAWLRAVIGRAREGMGIVEVELLSSVSEDVVELWNGTGVVRVLGKADICQLLHVASSGHDGVESFVRDVEEEGIELLEDMVGQAELCTLENGIRRGIMEQGPPESAAKTPIQIRSPQPFGFPSRFPNLAECIILILRFLTRRQKSNVVDFDKIPAAPNMSLNVGRSRSTTSERWTVAVFGVLLQTSVLVFAVVGVLLHGTSRDFLKQDKPSTQFALPLMTCGTALLVLSMFLCAYIIDSTTLEHVWECSDHARVFWLQKGGKVGDQQFDSYIILPHRHNGEKKGVFQELHAKRASNSRSNPGHAATSLVTSARSDRPQEGLTTVAVVICVFGFICQFTGLRFLHYSATLAQLVATVLMVAFRAWLRRNMVMVPMHEKLREGYELESTTKLLTGCQLINPIPGDFEEWLFPSPGRPSVANHNLAKEAGNRMPADFGVTLFPPVASRSLATEALEMYANLKDITGWSSKWDGTALKLAQALNVAMNTVFDSEELRARGNWDRLSIYDVSIFLEVTDNDWDAKMHFERVRLQFEREKSVEGWGRWKVSERQVCALLNMWMSDLSFGREREGVTSTGKDGNVLVYGVDTGVSRGFHQDFQSLDGTGHLFGKAEAELLQQIPNYAIGIPANNVDYNVDWLGRLSSTEVETLCGLFILHEFLCRLLSDFEPGYGRARPSEAGTEDSPAVIRRSNHGPRHELSISSSDGQPTFSDSSSGILEPAIDPPVYHLLSSEDSWIRQSQSSLTLLPDRLILAITEGSELASLADIRFCVKAAAAKRPPLSFHTMFPQLKRHLEEPGNFQCNGLSISHALERSSFFYEKRHRWEEAGGLHFIVTTLSPLKGNCNRCWPLLEQSCRDFLERKLAEAAFTDKEGKTTKDLKALVRFRKRLPVDLRSIDDLHKIKDEAAHGESVLELTNPSPDTELWTLALLHNSKAMLDWEEFLVTLLDHRDAFLRDSHNYDKSKRTKEFIHEGNFLLIRSLAMLAGELGYSNELQEYLSIATQNGHSTFLLSLLVHVPLRIRAKTLKWVIRMAMESSKPMTLRCVMAWDQESHFHARELLKSAEFQAQTRPLAEEPTVEFYFPACYYQSNNLWSSIFVDIEGYTLGKHSSICNQLQDKELNRWLWTFWSSSVLAVDRSSLLHDPSRRLDGMSKKDIALIFASSIGRKDIIRHLIHAGGTSNEHITTLCLVQAAAFGCDETFGIIIDHYDSTPAIAASDSRNTRLVYYHPAFRSRANPLEAASLFGHVNIVRTLLRRIPSIQATAVAIKGAITNKNPTILRLLLPRSFELERQAWVQDIIPHAEGVGDRAIMKLIIVFMHKRGNELKNHDFLSKPGPGDFTKRVLEETMRSEISLGRFDFSASTPLNF